MPTASDHLQDQKKAGSRSFSGQVRKQGPTIFWWSAITSSMESTPRSKETGEMAKIIGWEKRDVQPGKIQKQVWNRGLIYLGWQIQSLPVRYERLNAHFLGLYFIAFAMVNLCHLFAEQVETASLWKIRWSLCGEEYPSTTTRSFFQSDLNDAWPLGTCLGKEEPQQQPSTSREAISKLNTI